MPVDNTAPATVIPFRPAAPTLRHDGQLPLSVGRSKYETRWKNTEISWADLVAKLMTTTRTRETVTQYKGMTKAERDGIKDVGGFVGGTLKQGHRRTGHVLERSLLTLDADFATVDFPDMVSILTGCAYAVYTTHSHTADAPRYRLIIPLKRVATPDEYKALARFVAADIGIDLFDDSTYEPERLMYWPSTPEDGEYIATYEDAPWLDPDAVLRKHPFWQDATTWPESSRIGHERQRRADRQGDPREKPGVVGAFCRTYTVSQAITSFLDDVYEPCATEGRYTFKRGSTTAGLVLYDDDRFAYSNHGTDPAGGQLCNAFDLVRIHRFGELDEDAAPDTQGSSLPSYHEMVRFAIADPDTRIELATISLEEAKADFADSRWKADLAFTEKGALVKNINNAVLILENAIELANGIGYNDFTRRGVALQPLPWRKEPGAWSDADDSALRHHLEHVHGYKSNGDLTDAQAIVMHRHAFHPVCDYLDTLEWDGKPRVETLLIDMMAAEDTQYTRSVTRKWLTAAIARVRDPGCKFDNILILVGEQGLGKSQFFSRLTHNPAWFSDSMSRFDNSKESMEQLAGKWILELGELSVMRRSEIEAIKTFLSKQEDCYRPSYGRQLETFPRQCIFGGTTNRDDFLHDMTGGRRFWPVTAYDAKRMWAEFTPDYVDQVWAEADTLYALGEELYLSGEAASEASRVQDDFTESGGALGLAEAFLARKLPRGWQDRKSSDRQMWLRGYEPESDPQELFERTAVTGIELFVECFSGLPEDYKQREAFEMSDLLFKLGWKKTGERSYVADYGRQRVHRKA